MTEITATDAPTADDQLKNVEHLVEKTAELVREKLGQPVEVSRAPRQQLIQPEVRQPDATVTPLGMSHPDDMGEFFGAMAMAQSKFGNIERTLKAKINSRKGEGSSFGYEYAPLDEVLNAVRPALAGEGISVMQFPLTRQGSVLVRTVLGHKSGKYLWNDCAVQSVSAAPQDVGSAITYARRYGLQSITGVFPDSDDDGARGHGRDQITVAAGRGGDGEQDGDEEARHLITACREVKQGGRVLYGIKSTGGECWTDSQPVYEQAKAAQAQERRVILRTEMRPGATGGRVRWLTELVAG